MRGSLIAVTAAAVLVAPVLAAQGKPKEEQEVAIPESAWPPDGMCRVWLRDVPERQQPAPTDCVTALRTRPRDATLLMGQPTKEARLLLERASAAERSRRSLFEDPSPRGYGFRSIEPRGMTVGMSFNQMGPIDARSSGATPGQAKAVTGTAAAAKADATKPVIKPPEPYQR